MKILILAPALPYPPHDGARVMVYNLIRHLAPYHEITLLCFLEDNTSPANMAHVEGLGCRVEAVPLIPRRGGVVRRALDLIGFTPAWVRPYVSKQMADRLSRLVRQNHYDVVHLDTVLMAPYGRILSHLPRVIAPHDAVSLFLEQSYRTADNLGRKFPTWAMWRQMRRYEATVYPEYDACYVVSEQDAYALRALAPHLHVRCIPNGVDSTYYRPLGTEPDRPSVVFSGVMSYPPNREAALNFYHKIFPQIRLAMPDVRFYIVGRDPPPQIQALTADDKVTVTGTLVDLRPYIDKATVYVCPVQIASGIRNKVLEALAMGKAVVATSASCQGLEAVHGRDLIIADEPREFAEWTIRLLQDAETRQRLGQQGRQLVLKRYCWRLTALQVEALYEEARAIFAKRTLSGNRTVSSCHGYSQCSYSGLGRSSRLT